VLVGIADHPGDALHTSNLCGGALRVAAGDQNPALGIPAMNAAHELPHFRVRRGRNRARVQDRNLAIVGGGNFLKPCLKQLLLQRGAIGLAGAAAEIEDMKRRHAQKGIVAEMRAGRQASENRVASAAAVCGTRSHGDPEAPPS